MNILFVCTGNTCRSPMAQAIALKLIKEEPEKYSFIKVASAGLAAYDGDGPSFYAKEACEMNGSSLEDFRSQRVSYDLLEASDLILVMTEEHKYQLLLKAPQYADKIFTLGEFAGEDIDVGDPYGSNLEMYLQSYDLIEEQVKKVFMQLYEEYGGEEDENSDRQ